MRATPSVCFVDLSHESPEPLGRLARRLGIPLSTLRSWALNGARGVRLEVDSRGGRMLSSAEAVERFNERIQAGWSGVKAVPESRTARQRRREIEEACRRVEARLGRTRKPP